MRCRFKLVARHVAIDERAAIELAPFKLERFFTDIDLRVFETIAQRRKPGVRIVIDDEDRAAAADAARRAHFTLD